MNKSLLFLPDISGFTEFVQTTEVKHSQHVIAELLEVLLEANIMDLQLAEVEGDALFLYKEGDIPSLKTLLAQVETMFTAFYSHLRLLKKNRVCPCNACSSAPKLQLKIIAHCGEIEFMTVQGKRKPFGTQVIQAHRLMKNSIESDNYVLFSQDLADEMNLGVSYESKLFDFSVGTNKYDGNDINYLYSVIDTFRLKLLPFSGAKKMTFDKAPSFTVQKEYDVSAEALLEYITNYSFRHYWVDGVDKFEYDENEVTRVGTEHVCVIGGSHLNFVAVTKDGKPGQLVYGEMTSSPPPVDALFQFFILTPLTATSCMVDAEVYIVAKSPFKKLLVFLLVKRALRKNVIKGLDALKILVENGASSATVVSSDVSAVASPSKDLEAIK